MISFLVLAKDLPTAGHFEGDVIDLRDQNQVANKPWSAEENINRWVSEGNNSADFPDLFYVVEIDGLPLQAARRARKARERAAIITDSVFTAPDIEDRKVKIAERRWSFDPDNLNPAERGRLRDDRFLALPRGRVNAIFRDRSGRDTIDNSNPNDDLE